MNIKYYKLISKLNIIKLKSHEQLFIKQLHLKNIAIQSYDYHSTRYSNLDKYTIIFDYNNLKNIRYISYNNSSKLQPCNSSKLQPCNFHNYNNNILKRNNISDGKYEITKNFDNKKYFHSSSRCITNEIPDSKTHNKISQFKKENILTIPNALTGLRIISTPYLSYLILMQQYQLACGLFVLTGITDVLDGYIARTFPSQQSAFGSFLDPLADKLLVISVFASLSYMSLIPIELTALVITRDVLLIGSAFYVRYLTLPEPKSLKRYFDLNKVSVHLQPTLISKVNTGVQLSMLSFSLMAPVFGFVDSSYLQALWYVTACSTIVSGLSYCFQANTFKRV